jgi:hypothetical protein|tara:strand:- start:302 stop:1126 length:825 start_codon:yes stop_codon:yes gene_type:complete
MPTAQERITAHLPSLLGGRDLSTLTPKTVRLEIHSTLGLKLGTDYTKPWLSAAIDQQLWIMRENERENEGRKDGAVQSRGSKSSAPKSSAPKAAPPKTAPPKKKSGSGQASGQCIGQASDQYSDQYRHQEGHQGSDRKRKRASSSSIRQLAAALASDPATAAKLARLYSPTINQKENGAPKRVQAELGVVHMLHSALSRLPERRASRRRLLKKVWECFPQQAQHCQALREARDGRMQQATELLETNPEWFQREAVNDQIRYIALNHVEQYRVKS